MFAFISFPWPLASANVPVIAMSTRPATGPQQPTPISVGERGSVLTSKV